MLSLCAELIQEIGNKLVRIDQKCLRAVCKDIGLAINPLFFSTLVLKTQSLHSENGIYILKALASGDTGWSTYAMTLTIQPGGILEGRADSRFDISDSAVQELLASALGSLMNIRVVMWETNKKDPEWQQDTIRDFLTTCPLLDDFHLETGDVSCLPSPPLSGLRKLNITIPYGARTPLGKQVPHLVAQNHGLTSLHLLNYSGPWSEVWTMLLNNPDWNIHLTDISPTCITRNLLEYLGSYSGIQKLELRSPDDDHFYWRNRAGTAGR
ncbi:hypothetical protein FB451DRAFT_1529078 [Mycena latifolia]|nr:hypothetical protein FB451DRAFT_1529078 [Mycena latifolia]